MKKHYLFLLLICPSIKSIYIDPIDKEIREYFYNILEENNIAHIQKNRTADILEEDKFPNNNTNETYAININRSDKNNFIIEIDTKSAIAKEKIESHKNERYIKINIENNSISYNIILEKNKFLISTSSNKKIKNNTNTKHMSSSSQMSRQELLQNNIDLDTANMIVETESGKITITVKYIDSEKKNKSGINIEYK